AATSLLQLASTLREQARATCIYLARTIFVYLEYMILRNFVYLKYTISHFAKAARTKPPESGRDDAPRHTKTARDRSLWPFDIRGRVDWI
ncbi:hypothetical protein, partial [Parafannyhessea umbonata]|uniref:hypothetical protein n=1 Tax=Parafannyhessea umbonata TaxID=604330 RepID=UPI0026EB4608